MDEYHLWGEIKDLVLAPTREIAQQMYVEHVMRPLLGSEHVDAGIRLLASKEFLEAVEKKVLNQRPSWRVKAAKVNPLSDSVLLISDHTMFPRGNHEEEFSIAVEIKPKSGFLPFSEFIAEGNSIKRTTTRFKMHQALKLYQGKVSQISEYDPLDLFSRSRGRVCRAIKALFVNPQNNFRVFLNGSLIFGGPGGVAENTSCKVGQRFEDALEPVILTENGTRTDMFLELVSDAVLKSGALEKLLEAQKLDAADVEGAIHVYYDIVSQPCKVCRKGGDELSQRYITLHKIPMEERLKIVRDFLISATAKDLSMMISFRPRKNGAQQSSYKVLHLASINQSFDYKAAFIDLDMKPLKKMEYYYDLDQQIVSCYVQMVNGNPQLGDAIRSEETSEFVHSDDSEDAFQTNEAAEIGG